MKKSFLIWMLLAGLLLLLAACKSPAPATSDPNVARTAAAQTARAKLKKPDKAVTVTPGQPANSPAPPGQVTTATLPLPAATTAAAVVPMTPGPIIAPAQGTPGVQAQPGDAAEFVADVTVPDGTRFNTNEPFIKTWRLKNTGSSTWTSAYSLGYTNGDKMVAPDNVPLTANVAPGEMVDISVNMTAPDTTGDFIGYWMMRNSTGNLFGLGAGANEPIYVQITVGGSGGTAVPGGTGAAVPTFTPTPGKTSGEVVASANLSVDNASATSCPHTFTFLAEFNLTKAATVTYRLQVEGNSSLKLPEPTTVNLNAGRHSLVYTLQVATAFNGWAQLHFIAPEDIVSNKLDLNLVCK